MTEAGLAVFVLVGFLLPVPVLAWLTAQRTGGKAGNTMYVGHFAAGLAIKAREPRAPTWALLVGVGLLDILFGPFVLAGIERATVTPSVSPGFSLDYIDWSHSLVMSLVWSVLFAAAFARYGRRVMMTTPVPFRTALWSCND